MSRAPVLGAVLALLLGLGKGVSALESFTPSLGVVYIPRPALYDSGDHILSGPPIATNTLGMGLVFPIGSGRFVFEPGLSFYWTYHLWIAEEGRALPAELEHRTSFTLGFILETPFLVRFRLSETIGLSLGLGPAFHPRLGFLATGVPEDEKDDVARINRFFWEGGRFFVPETILRFEYSLTERADFAFAAQGFWPVFNWWNGSDWFWDEGIFGGTLSIRYKPR